MADRPTLFKYLAAGLAAGAGAPAVAAGHEESLSPIAECERLAQQLMAAMNRVRAGNYKVTVDHEYGFVLVVDHEWKREQEGPLVGTEAYAEWEKRRKSK